MADTLDPFVHLHVHSEYSMLDGLGRVKNLVKEAKKLGQPALALTDHGVMHGAIEFFRACKDGGIKPLIGVEAYQTAYGRPMSGRDSQLDRENHHLLLLARNMTGYRNMLQIATQAQLSGYYYRPRVDHEFLASHAEGLICTTGCLGAEVPNLLMNGKEKEAYERLGWYVDVFGKENFFIELQEHNIRELQDVNKILVPWAKEFGLKLVPTNDVHYVKEADGIPHDVLLCVQTGATVHEEKRMRMSDTSSYFLKSRSQMEDTFRPFIDLPDEAFNHTLEIMEMCEVDLEDPTYHLPDLPIPEGHTYDTYLRELTEEGLHRLYGARADSEAIQERKERELRVISQMGFSIYFLIVGDLCNFARSQNIWWNVRGSGAGSLVAYCIGITGLDPLKNSLIFERFLNPGRVSMPDFDLDFPDDQREEMIKYTIERFGTDQVAQIATFNRMKAKAAVRDVGRAQGIDLAQVDKIAKLIPGIPGKPVFIMDCLTEGHEFYSAELTQMYQTETWVKELLETAMQLEGVARNSGIHAAAVIVADRPLSHYTPLMRSSKSAITSTVAQYEFPILESIGLLKVDFLGLSTLSVMREACRIIKERHGIEYTLQNIPFEGEPAIEAFRLLASGEVSGVFQVESQGMRRVLTEMKPTMFEHIIAMISLYRPGPLEYIPAFIRRMHGEEEVDYKHPELESILSETYGICVSGDALVTDVRSGRRCRLDELGDDSEFLIQGVDEDWQPAVGQVSHWIDNGVKPVYQVTLRNGSSIKVTADHQLLSENGWQPLNQLKVGDHIATPLKLFGVEEQRAQKVDPRKLRVLAYLIADGSLASMASVDFVSKDQDMIDEYVCCLQAFGDIRPVFTEQIRQVTRVGIAKAEDAGLHYHTPTALLQWMRDLGLKHPAGSRPGGLRSHEKFIPPFVFELGESDIAFFLASLWDCDGYMGRKLCHYKTISKQLADDVQTLLLRVGVRSTIHLARYENSNQAEATHTISYQVTVYDTEHLARLLQPHMISPKKSVQCTGQSSPSIRRDLFLSEVAGATQLSPRALMHKHGIDRQHFYAKRRNLPRISSRIVSTLTDVLTLPETKRHTNVDWQEIVSIESAGEEHVYDLTVEGLHNFVANNIIVHNCVYQEQIIQILSKLAGYTPGEADLVRRAVSKKKASDIEKHKKLFIAGCEKNGINGEIAGAIYADIEFFARYGFNKCLPGNVEVVDAQSGRLVTVEDLYKKRVQIEQTVTCDTSSLKLKTGAISAVMNNGVKPVYRLTTALGRQIEATANHPFYSFDGWRLLEELAVGDQIAVPRQLPVEGKAEWPDHEVIALGHLLAEGNLCHPHSVYFYSQASDQCNDYIRAAESFENVACSIAVHKDTFSIYAKRIDATMPPGIVNWAEELGIRGKTATEKEIPPAAFELTNRQIGILISRMWEGDGHINLKGRSLYYATSSERMARQLQHLLLRFGIISRLRTVNFPYKEGRIGYQLFITGNENITLFEEKIATHFVSDQRKQLLDQLSLTTPASSGAKDVIPVGIKDVVRREKESSSVSWTQLNAECGVAQREFYPTGNTAKSGFSRQTIQRLADYFGSGDLHRYAQSDIYWDKVVSIEYVGEKETYDLEVPGTHNFVANDILVHNSHAADYAVITVQTAYLKAHYPVEYMAAQLLIERDKTEKVTNFITECRRMGVDVLPPDVNYSNLDFDIQIVPPGTQTLAQKDPSIAYKFPIPDGAAIRFGMAAIKNVGEGPVQEIIKGRKDGGPFKTLEDFGGRVDLRKVNKRALECLIKAGCLDSFGKRSQLLAVLDTMVANSGSAWDAQESGQLSIFDLFGDNKENSPTSVAMIKLPDIEEAKGKEKLQWEKELLGVYSISHPLNSLGADLLRVVTCSCAELDEKYDGKNIILGGLISNIRTITTKKGDPMAFVQLEDLQGSCEVVFFPKTYVELKDQLLPDMVLLIKGKAQTREGRTSLLADSIQRHIDKAVGIGEDRSSEYQKPLLDVPTINGTVFDKNANFAATAVLDSEIDDVLPTSEASPFTNDMPTWLQDAPPPPMDEDEADGESLSYPVAAAKPATPVQPSAKIAEPSPAYATKPSSPAPVAAKKSLPEPALIWYDFDAREDQDADNEDNEETDDVDATSVADAATALKDETAIQTESEAVATSNAPEASAQTESVEQEKAKITSEVDVPLPAPSLPSPKAATAEASEPMHRRPAPTANGYTNGQANGHANGTGKSESSKDDAGTNGNASNGHTGNGHATNGLATNGLATNSLHAKHLRIALRRSGDIERDKYRLKQIYDAVCDPRGRDRFFIRLVGESRSAELSFPNDGCTVSEKLLGDLTKHFRVEVTVEE